MGEGERRDRGARVSRWLAALWQRLQLQVQCDCLAWTPGWVVMAEEYDGSDWHAMSQGEAYGMDYESGRFPNRESARVYCAYRNAAAEAHEHNQRFYVTHERLLSYPLPRSY